MYWQNGNKAIQDGNNYIVSDTCYESNHETFCKHLLGKLNSKVCLLKCESNKERNNNCSGLLKGGNNNNCETSAILLRESNRQKFSNNGVISNNVLKNSAERSSIKESTSISQSVPENCDPIDQDEVYYNDLFIKREYYEIDDQFL